MTVAGGKPQGFGSYKVNRNEPYQDYSAGERLDTVEGLNDLYDDEEQSDEDFGDAA